MHIASWRPHRHAIPAALTAILLLIFCFGVRPAFTLQAIETEDAADYAFEAAALLEGHADVAWTGAARETNFTPGFPLLLAPAVALGGIEAAIWVPYLAALLLGGLIALVAAELGGPLAAPVAVAAVLFGRDVVSHAQVVLSDLPTATLAVAQLALLTRAGRTRGRLALALAGVCAGCLPWLRPATILFLVAGVAALTALPGRRRTILVFLAAAAPPVLLLGAWQWAHFGSPLVTAYQAHGASSDGSGAMSALFSLKYVVGQSFHEGNVPNAFLYPLHVLGLDGSSLLPGLGGIGLTSAVLWAHRQGSEGAVGRFSLAVLAVTFLTYLPYFWQDTRFLMTPTILLGVCGAVALTRGLLRLSRLTATRSGVASLAHRQPVSA